MNMKKSLTLISGTLFLIFFVAVNFVYADCQEISASSQKAVNQQDITKLTDLYALAKTDDSCSSAFRLWLGKQIAISYTTIAKDNFQSDKKEEAISALQKSREFYSYWMALAMLGDVESEKKNHGQASLYYQEALDEINDEERMPKAPRREIIAKIFKKAEQSRLLEDMYVKSPKNRAGEVGGLAAISYRGFTPEKVAVPVTFNYDSTTFTDKGRDAVMAMLDELQEQGQKNIVLAGHTDPVGEADYNQKLSQQRAEAVKNLLQSNGYNGQIRVLGIGESELYSVVDRANVSTEEFHQLCRRVELERR